MNEEDKNKKGNGGCAIAVGLFVLANIVCFFLTSSDYDIAETGGIFLVLVFFAVAYIGVKAYLSYIKESDNKFLRIGVPIIIIIGLMILFGAIMSDFSSMVVIGVIGFIVVCIIFGLFIYNSYKD